MKPTKTSVPWGRLVMKERRLLSSMAMLVRRPSSMRRATWASLGETGARLRRFVARLSTLMVMSFAVRETGDLA
jgi:hypothetical protein